MHAQTLDAYVAGDKPRTILWGERQGWVNVVEPFRSPFAIGDAHVLSGHFDLARPWFEQAFEQVPKGGIDDCKVRVNLGLTYEALGDAAKARERTDEWKQYYAKGITITKERPPLCEAPDGGKTGEQLQQAQQRMEQKNADAPPRQLALQIQQRCERQDECAGDHVFCLPDDEAHRVRKFLCARISTIKCFCQIRPDI